MRVCCLQLLLHSRQFLETADIFDKNGKRRRNVESLSMWHIICQAVTSINDSEAIILSKVCNTLFMEKKPLALGIMKVLISYAGSFWQGQLSVFVHIYQWYCQCYSVSGQPTLADVCQVLAIPLVCQSFCKRWEAAGLHWEVQHRFYNWGKSNFFVFD